MALGQLSAAQADQERITREKEYHGKFYSDDTSRKSADQFYRINAKGNNHYEDLVKAHAKGRILEFGCGIHSVGFQVAGPQVHFEAIDISDVAIEQCIAGAQRKNIQDYSDFKVMNAEALTYPDHSFNLVFGAGILHHLDMEKSLAEIYRVLQPGGKAVFLEPLGANPVINLYRDRTPDIRSPDEHPLVAADIDLINRQFDNTKLHFYHLFTLAAAPIKIQPLFKAVYAFTGMMDAVALKLPGLRYWAWQVLIEVQKPA